MNEHPQQVQKMRPKTPTYQPLRSTQFERLEEILALSVSPLPDFYLDEPVETSAEEIAGELRKSLADVNDIYGTTHAHNTYGFTGSGQTVAVIDSGIAWDHESLGAGLGEDFRVVGGWDFTEENDADPYDDGPGGFHGTHVAGIIGSDSNEHTGVAPGVDLVGLRVFNDQGEGYFSWVENALDWVHTNKDSFANPITTVNLSLGTDWNADSVPNWGNLEDEFAQLEADGIFISVSAGNSFTTFNTAGLSYPAVSPFVVPVASVDNDGAFSSFSQRNDRVIAAPGRSIMSTIPDYVGNNNGQGDDYGTASGTSMAAPYLAGASVLVRQAMEFVGTTDITQDMIYDHMRATGDTFYDSATDANYSRLNLQSSLDALMPTDDFGSTAADAYSMGTVMDTMSLSGLIGRMNDADFFTFTAGATGTIAMDVQETHDLSSQCRLVGGGGSMENGSFVFDVIAGQSYTLGLDSTAGIGYYDIGIELTPSMVDLGAVQDLRLDNQAISGETWYQVQATRDGLLTLQAKFSHAAGDVDLEVYDSNMQLLASSATASDTERLDVAVAAGETVYVRVVGTNADVDLRAANLIQVAGSTATLFGTSSNDVISFTADATTHQATINGLQYTFDASTVTSFDIRGESGSDTVTLTGTSGDETATLRPSSGEFVGTDFSVSVTSAENIKVYGGGGNDVAKLYDSAGDDLFKGKSSYSYMRGNNFHNYVRGFDAVYAYATAGGNDVARLYDSAGDDYFKGKYNYSYMRGESSFNYAHRFDSVYAYATAGGNDVARLYDTAGDEEFIGRSTESSMRGDIFYNHARGFDSVYAYATAGGNDVARLYDSAGDDYFKGKYNYSYMRGETFFNYAHRFDSVYAYATAGGNDVARLYDSTGDDYFKGKYNYSYMRGETFFNYAHRFDSVYAYATAGGNDVARLYDTAGDEEFIGRSTESYMRGETFYNHARGFDSVYAYATAGGNDVARLYDSASDDYFKGKYNYSYMRGETFFNYAHRFDSVYAYATAGGNDLAALYGLTDDHTFFGRNDEASILGWVSNLEGYGFERVSAVASQGQAPQSDISALDYIFSQSGNWN